MSQGKSRMLHGILALAMVLTALLWGSAGTVAAAGGGDTLYTLSNAVDGNSVLIFHRSGDGSVTSSSVPTGGLGTGAGLGSQGALVLSQNGRLLFAVNAGSSEISSFRVLPHGLELVNTIPSGGEMPISVTASKGLLYVLNAGGAGNITGFTFDASGALTPLSGSTRLLSGNSVGPAQVEFSPSGRVLVVTEKATNLISTYTVGMDGRATGPTSHASSGVTPFGFAFANRDQLIVSEAFGGAPDASALSSYRLGSDSALHAISDSVGTTETAACWVVVTRNGQYAYTTNTGSGSVSGYRIGHDGSLTLLDSDGRTGVTGDGSSPIDMALDKGSRFLYTLNAGTDSISVFRVGSDGSLVGMGMITGLPDGAVGLAAR